MINILWVVSLRVNCPSACMIDALIGITALIDMRDSVGFWRNTFQCLSILTISRYFHSMNVAANYNLSYIITTIHLTKSTLSYIHLRSYDLICAVSIEYSCSYLYTNTLMKSTCRVAPTWSDPVETRFFPEAVSTTFLRAFFTSTSLTNSTEAAVWVERCLWLCDRIRRTVKLIGILRFIAIAIPWRYVESKLSYSHESRGSNMR